MLWITFITLVLGPGHAPITLSETYWQEEACLARIPDMNVLFSATVAGSGAEILDGGACVPVDESDDEEVA